MKKMFNRNYKTFTIDIMWCPSWKLKFWWRDWHIQRDRKVKQRLWKLQIAKVQFVYWRKR